MIFDKEQVKALVSLRDLFEGDGHVLKNSGPDDAVCRCPFHEEKTASCHVHDKKAFYKCFGCGASGDCFDYWTATRGMVFQEKCGSCGGKGSVNEVWCGYCDGCGYVGSLPDLAKRAGVAAGKWSAAKVAPKSKLEVVEELAGELSEERQAKWKSDCDFLLGDDVEMKRISDWRGYSMETIRWAVDREIMGMTYFMGAWREAFLVERPVLIEPGETPDSAGGTPALPNKLIPVGWHIRLAPGSPGNDSMKNSWRYPWAGIGSWPFVIGDVSTAKVIFCMEGQWDALALVDLMFCENGAVAIPKGVAIVGMRGATSWKRFLKYFVWPEEVTVFAIADRDNAGKAWFEPEGFIEELQPRCRRVWGFYPNADRGLRNAERGAGKAEGFKDFNDVHKARAISREHFRAMLHAKLRRVATKKKMTFLKWCRAEAGKRADAIGMAAFLVVRDKERPRGRKPIAVWERHWARSASEEHLPALRDAWREWMAVG